MIHFIFWFNHSPQGLPKGYEDVPFYFWFNTSFIEDNKYVSDAIIYLAPDSNCSYFVLPTVNSFKLNTFPLNSQQAVSTQRGAGQPTQTKDLGPVQGGLWCHYVLLRTIIKVV